jgi:DNA-binding NtrC family response regulator
MSYLLVVEDEAPLRNEMADGLVRAGHRVDAASGGNQALARLKEMRYDLLLTDLLMDEGTGFEVLAWVRDNAPGLPVLICSSYAKPENLKPFLNTQLYRILRKPCPLDDLLEQVRQLLEGSTK